jgi:DAK2 domain fusion protein YloV
MDFLDRVDELHGGETFGYCTNFMVVGKDIDFDRARRELAAMGQSAVIVGDNTILKVHIHTLNPGKLLDRAINYGDLEQITIDNMSSQTRALTDQRAQAARTPTEDHGKQAVLAVASGEGIGEALRALGAREIVAGGQTMNPSIEELLEAVERAPTFEVILLPNNSNIAMTARQVASLATKHVLVVPTRTIPQGLAALTAYNSEASIEANFNKMAAAVGGVQTAEISRAEKDATVDGIQVKRGQAIGMLDHLLVTAGDDMTATATETLTKASLDHAELVTIFYGQDAARADAEQIERLITATHPKLTVEVYDGGQPHYHFVISVE